MKNVILRIKEPDTRSSLEITGTCWLRCWNKEKPLQVTFSMYVHYRPVKVATWTLFPYLGISKDWNKTLCNSFANTIHIFLCDIYIIQLFYCRRYVLLWIRTLVCLSRLSVKIAHMTICGQQLCQTHWRFYVERRWMMCLHISPVAFWYYDHISVSIGRQLHSLGMAGT